MHLVSLALLQRHPGTDLLVGEKTGDQICRSTSGAGVSKIGGLEEKRREETWRGEDIWSLICLLLKLIEFTKHIAEMTRGSAQCQEGKRD